MICTYTYRNKNDNWWCMILIQNPNNTDELPKPEGYGLNLVSRVG